MRWRLAFIMVFLLALGNGSRSPAQSDAADSGGKGVSGVPLREVAAPLREMWLRFHESELCLGVDSVFVFQPKGMEVWCRIREEKNYQALVAMAEQLQKTYRIDIYATHPERDKKPWSPDDDDPLPSLWTNAELRAYFRDPFASRMGAPDDGAPVLGQIPDSRVDPAVKRRMKLYGDQLLDWTGKMERLANDVPALAGAGFGADATPDTQGRARAVCLDHVREVGKLAVRLGENLTYALPRGSRDYRPPSPEKPAEAAGDPARDAQQVSLQAREIARRIKRFLYPQAHTVGLADLREPGLLDSLKTLQKAVSDFERIARKAR